MKPVILVTRKLPDAVEERLQRDYDPILNPTDRLYSSDEIIEMAEKVDAILPCHTEKFTAAVIERLPDNVKAIANFSVGYDHVDVEAAKQHGLIVTNTPEVLSDATAELTIMLMLGAARRASEGERLVRTRQWKDWSPRFMVGTQVTGKRLGILGYGRVGQVVAKRARACRTSAVPPKKPVLPWVSGHWTISTRSLREKSRKIGWRKHRGEAQGVSSTAHVSSGGAVLIICSFSKKSAKRR
ncbi:MAG: NAD(P)-dependent oxidoreductase [Desulfofustis sp.]